ncbi:hypothetical protein HOLleu_35581 [Holothuria leucospilota]|uniref:SRCR domain-containing protein n=1 Tax=Holothuria leucospilota TaxID=206669 RepID=A0A9Q0YN43_HOLLE|nr:hypothetical protein HOLleu_35581 [Holothuria leucospilota]
MCVYFSQTADGLQGIRLTNATNSLSGQVKVLYDNQWGLVCGDDQWDMSDASVVCRQLGYDKATQIHTFSPRRVPKIVWMSNVQCRGNETSISSCRHERFRQGSCSIGKYAGVTCQELFVYTGDGLQGIRLVGGTYTPSGRVELLINETWGAAMADYFWDFLDARVVCRQLGYQTAISITENLVFAKLSGPVWMGDVQCTGNEKSISRCKHTSPKHLSEYVDAGIVCGGNAFYLL